MDSRRMGDLMGVEPHLCHSARAHTGRAEIEYRHWDRGPTACRARCRSRRVGRGVSAAAFGEPAWQFRVISGGRLRGRSRDGRPLIETGHT
jgi:hypothetical protein